MPQNNPSLCHNELDLIRKTRKYIVLLRFTLRVSCQKHPVIFLYLSLNQHRCFLHWKIMIYDMQINIWYFYFFKVNLHLCGNILLNFFSFVNSVSIESIKL